VTLDSDAFPFSDTWLDELRLALAQPGCTAAGMRGRRNRLHPACAIYDRAAYFDARTSCTNFTPFVDWCEDPVFGENTWDTSELLFKHLGRDRVTLLPTEPSPLGGTVMAGAVYHHEQMTTIQLEEPSSDVVARSDRWHVAVTELLGSAS